MKEKYLRKARILLLSPKLWRKRLIFWLGAILIGLTASYFSLVADWAQDMFNTVVSRAAWAPLILSPLVFALSAWLTRKYCPAAIGSGLPQAIAARILRDPKSRRYLIGWHIIPGKILLTTLGLLGGASIGREGPTIQIGAAILMLAAGLSGLSAERGIVIAGASAGVAAAFNTPLAGIVLAIEEMARAFEHRNSSVVLAAIVFSGAAAMSVTGNYSYFGYADTGLVISRDWLAILLVGAAGGLLGSLFCKCIINGVKHINAASNNFVTRHPVGFAASCGLVIAVTGLLTGNATYGSGYSIGYSLLHGTLQATWWQVPAKMLTTAISAISGIPGGFFSPSLSIGASLGSLMSGLFPNTPMQGVVLLAMAAYFAGVTQAPITTFVIVLEITGKGTAAMPLIAATVIAAAISRILCPVSLYHSLAKNFIIETKKVTQAVPTHHAT